MLLNDFKLLSPEIFLAISSIFILMYGIFFKDDTRSNRNIFYITIFTLIFSLYLSLTTYQTDTYVFDKLISNSAYAQFFKILILIGSITICLISYNYLTYLGILKPEYFFLILLTTLGILIMISSHNILSMYLGLELQSICLYILATYRKDYLKSAESGVKYFILGALSSGILLYGLSLIYSFTNSTDFIEISYKLKESSTIIDNQLLIATGFVLVLSGLFFKVAAVPFHMWAPDLYEGSPTPITAFFTTIPKIGAIAILIKILNIPFEIFKDSWFYILSIVSVISMVVGSIAAINQQNIKRLLAYSSINHMGFILLGILTANQIGLKSVQLYLIIYTITILGLFSCLLCIKDEKNGKYLEDINSFAGLIKKNTILSFSLVILLFSITGIPPLAGFFSKLYILISIIDSKLYFLAIVAVLTTVISAFYYLKIIKVILFDSPNNPIYLEVPFVFKNIIYLAVLFSLLFIFFGSEILNFIDKYTFIS